jgi:hypothetical protein
LGLVLSSVTLPRVFIEENLAYQVDAKVYAGNQPSIDAGTQLLQGMKDWITAAQPYRHGQEVEEPTEPPIEFVVAFLSAGAVYMRWLVELYATE